MTTTAILPIQTDPLNQTTTNTYDKQNRLVDVRDPLLGHTQTQYDPLDQSPASSIHWVRRPITPSTAWATRRRPTAPIPDHPEGFDAAGNVLSETPARGKTTNHQYDALNRLTRTTFDDGAELTYT